MKPRVKFQDLGKIRYQDAWDYQHELLNAIVAEKRQERTDLSTLLSNNYLLFCEHNPVYTLGKSGSESHLKRTPDELESLGIEFFKINRGGDITYHGPGQITGYPILNLDLFFRDVHRYVRTLEEVIIQSLKEYGLNGERVVGYTGVWLAPDEKNPFYRKICAIGVHLSRWVTMHGFALNVNTELPYFENIIPCGILDDDKRVTSLAIELGEKQDMNQVKLALKDNFARLFEFEYTNDKT